jgi:CheY-like chemotaxis protein
MERGSMAITTRPQHGSAQILVIDDDHFVREALSEALASESYSVVEATNGDEALTLLHQGVRPNLCLLDLMMPVMTGWQFLEHLQSEPDLKDIPVVVFSAAARGLDVSGAREVLKKPLKLDDLLAAVDRNLS